MRYVEYINGLIAKKVLEPERIVLFGQNIAAGSHLTGLTKGLRVKEGGFIINATNSEYTLTGLGFGLMINGVPSIFFTKQQDFLLLGTEQLVDTYNFIRRKQPSTSFTIVLVVLDLGYHGPQSSINNLGDLASLARVPAFLATNKVDTEEIINTHLISPGFRIIEVSQRLFGQELLEPEKIYSDEEKTLFQYAKGDDASVICFNLSFPEGFWLYNKLKERGVNASLFSVNITTPILWDKIIEDVDNAKNIIIMDNSKSENLSCYSLLSEIREKCGDKNIIFLKRNLTEGEWVAPNADQLEVNYDDIINRLV